MQRIITAFASFCGAVLASACCIGPSLAATLGIAGFAALSSLAVYRPYFMGLALVSLGYAYFLTFRKKANEICETRPRQGYRPNRGDLMLWAMTLFVALVSLFPYYSQVILE